MRSICSRLAQAAAPYIFPHPHLPLWDGGRNYSGSALASLQVASLHTSATPAGRGMSVPSADRTIGDSALPMPSRNPGGGSGHRRYFADRMIANPLPLTSHSYDRAGEGHSQHAMAGKQVKRVALLASALPMASCNHGGGTGRNTTVDRTMAIPLSLPFTSSSCPFPSLGGLG